MIGNQYGVITLGVRYAIAIILPIVGTFFLAFSVIEDSGYLPRLAMLIDRVFKKIGLNGRAVIPMVLGFGCDTMATIVTRTLETRRERVLSTILLSLAIPCSAQLGVMLGMLSGRNDLLLIWAAIMTGIFLLVAISITLLGYIHSRSNGWIISRHIQVVFRNIEGDCIAKPINVSCRYGKLSFITCFKQRVTNFSAC